LPIGKDKWERIDAAELVSNFEKRVQTISQRDFAEMADVPRLTLRYWLARKNSIDAHPALIEFFENPIGIAFLHRLLTAAHVSFTKNGTASIHNISDFLEKSGLAPFVASSDVRCELLWADPIPPIPVHRVPSAQKEPEIIRDVFIF